MGHNVTLYDNYDNDNDNGTLTGAMSKTQAVTRCSFTGVVGSHPVRGLNIFSLFLRYPVFPSDYTRHMIG
jgi:hypothetical protein